MVCVVLIEGPCALGGGFLRRACGAPPVGQCVYCGSPFCERHGELGPDFHEVCAKPACRSKYADVRAHRAWIDQHRAPNAVSMCAEDGCGERMLHLCQRCQLRFCEAHVQPGQVREQRAPQRRVTVALMLCAHCTARRRIWD